MPGGARLRFTRGAAAPTESAGRPGRPSGGGAAGRSLQAAATSSADADGVEWKVLASLLLLGVVFWADLLDRQQRQAEVTDLGEQAMQGRLVDDGPSDQGLAGRIAADLEAVEPAGPVTVEDTAYADLVVGGRSAGPVAPGGRLIVSAGRGWPAGLAGAGAAVAGVEHARRMQMADRHGRSSYSLASQSAVVGIPAPRCLAGTLRTGPGGRHRLKVEGRGDLGAAARATAAADYNERPRKAPSDGHERASSPWLSRPRRRRWSP
jgi:hypothetical protein